MLPTTSNPSISSLSWIIPLFLLPILIYMVPPVESTAQCYYPNAKATPADVPCDPTAEVSYCCGQDYVCTSIQGLCVGNKASESRYSRGTCTDSSWASISCPTFCMNASFSNGDPMKNCGGDQFCCTNKGADCCGGNTFALADEDQIQNLTTIGLLASSTTYYKSSSTVVLTTSSLAPGTGETGFAQTSSTSAAGVLQTGNAVSSSDTGGLSIGAKVGLGVGISLGVIVLASIIAYVVFQRTRIDNFKSGYIRPQAYEMHEMQGVEMVHELH